ncbi:type II toxin-antitoxin system death-on-curing family toxin [Pelagibacterium sp. H642]|uniref:type II toxin-antitoxin system death-on-curing family toxin n=1 Tax=Pelagibacterium sp. H642 TaxID=1881069 RepID=UPI002814DA1D|nr:type II toxin-antitoxin system death-on-curing family toxin [Pelagibacterium sp. H642]WMT89735.1 type II toxin-antitoxin system death-on-curing family toxin [Pelagibacterium sp. H642]
MIEPQWLSPRALLAMHDETLAAHGGLPGLRDPGALDSALSRAPNLFEYDQGDLFDLAAAYAGGIVKNHPFADGNKRAAFLASYVFLTINGYELEASEPDVVVTVFALAAGELSEESFAAWLRAHAVKMS